ncbi:MAG: bifunctional (p)ppGpp synthetase/guanosine-3',5'-bis(diphosphate) 3'-pyrophosphohydrolase [Armatimonadetes bacterium]|nr:bifunctional (p)ppGpp synthetase/guanosine-3',5'-bis(diphosphate) 3'-pyrophosphohydrolase [Armatimonadota bacterium]MDE2205754.1 bifunctional (p)ppGpp synthetase/guanosine-3',5'-bis(diphosphate) 3'-pyrophosphohydrolase [Armatimonadota bacterium]
MDADRPDTCKPDELFGRVIADVLRYRPAANIDLLRRAYAFARSQHGDSPRKSGELFIMHPLHVAQILAELEMDEVTLAAGLLHDVVEDCQVTKQQIASEFGAEVGFLVEGLTNLPMKGVDAGKPEDTARDEDEPVVAAAGERRRWREEVQRNALNIRKMLVATANDLRVIVIKLADRLHNMRTLDALPHHRQLRMANETLQIFAPLAHRLGIWQLKWQLEDLAFKYVEPEEFARVAELVAENRAQRQADVNQAISILQASLQEQAMQAEVRGRPKHLYSIYNKMKNQGLEFDQLFDLTALRVIVNTRQECYQALGIVSDIWRPLPGMFSDYITNAKSNMYQSLHIKVLGPKGAPLEVQIRTWEMHRVAEFGIAAHWQYKEGGKVNDKFERRLAALRNQLAQWQDDSRDHGDFLRNVTDDLFTAQIFVYSPKGDVIDLPAGSTPIDFAYRIHSEVGQHCVGARVNGRVVPLSSQLSNMDNVEIMTRSNAVPSRDWMAFVKTSHARVKIRSYFRRLNHAENVARGREMLQKEMANLTERDARAFGDEPRALLKDESLRAVARLFNTPNETELLASIGFGTISPQSVLNRLKPQADLQPRLQIGGRRSDDARLRITVGGDSADNVEIRRSRCCLPIPGDAVIGYVTRGRGLALHRRECSNASQYLQHEAERCTPVEYLGHENQVFQVVLRVDMGDRTGIIADIGFIFAELKTNITAINTQSHRNRTATLTLSIEVRDTDHLARIIDRLRLMHDVISISRSA